MKLQATHERFWSKVQQGDECWEWLAQKKRDGYGRFNFQCRSGRLAHRVAWILTKGPIPDGLCVLHRCDNRSCVRPDHLFLGTTLDNMRDRLQKGRFYNGWDRIPLEERKARMAHVRSGWTVPGGQRRV